jgi:hypothetical protein
MPGEKADRIVVFIEGKAAEEMYNGISQKPVRDRCAHDVVSKKVGNFVCSKLNVGTFFCTLGIGLRDGRILNGRTC